MPITRAASCCHYAKRQSPPEFLDFTLPRGYLRRWRSLRSWPLLEFRCTCGGGDLLPEDMDANSAAGI